MPGSPDNGSPLLPSLRLGVNAVALLSPLTGIGQYTYHLVSELQGLLTRAPYLFYATRWQQELRDAPVPNADILKKTFKFIVPQSYKVSRLLQQAFFSSGIRRHRIDLYHEPNFLSFRYRGPTVVTVHDLSWIRYPQTHPPQRVRLLNELLPKTLARADHIVVDSEFIRKEVIDYYGVAENRITSALLGVRAAFRPASPDTCLAVLNRHGLRHGHYILAVGTLEPRKNLAVALLAFSRLPAAMRRHYPLVIAGARGWGLSAFTRDAQEMITRGEVILTRYVGQADLPLLYAGARMLVYPSLYEGFGLPPLEAMASGIPVIASNHSSLPEVIGDAGILLDSPDDLALASSMLRLIDDEALHRQLVASGQARACHFTWRKCALDTLRVYQKALA